MLWHLEQMMSDRVGHWGWLVAHSQGLSPGFPHLAWCLNRRPQELGYGEHFWTYGGGLIDLGQEILLSVYFEGSLTFMTVRDSEDWDFLHLHRVLKSPFPLKSHFLLQEIPPISHYFKASSFTMQILWAWLRRLWVFFTFVWSSLTRLLSS